MPLATMTEMLRRAKEGKYAVGAFNIVDFNSARAVVQAAERLQAPVIVQTSVRTVRFWGAATIVYWMKGLAAESPVPVALHLDHCKEPAQIAECIDAGWTSVMIDASDKPFTQNLEITRKVVALANEAGVSVEAEMGRIVGVEEDIFVSQQQGHLADPDEAAAFCKDLNLAVFAPAIGTAHGIYKGEPQIAFDRLEEIARRTGLPMALHGGTGLSDEVFRKAIALGCAKVNISTAIKYAFIDSFVDYHAAHKKYEPLGPLGAQLECVEQMVSDNVRLFGAVGEAV